MAVYFIFDIYMNEIQLPDIAENSVFYGFNYMIAENANAYDQQCKANVTTTEENHLLIADSFTPMTAIYFDYDLDSNFSNDIYTTADGIFSLFALDHHFNLNELSISEAPDPMDGIAYGEFLDFEEEHADDERFNQMIDEVYNQMELQDLNTEFNSLNFSSNNPHVSAWKFCTICDTYWHSIDDH